MSKRTICLSFCAILGEANLFEEALQKYGKDFSDIQKDFVSSSLCRLLILWWMFQFLEISNYILCWVIIHCHNTHGSYGYLLYSVN